MLEWLIVHEQEGSIGIAAGRFACVSDHGRIQERFLFPKRVNIHFSVIEKNGKFELLAIWYFWKTSLKGRKTITHLLWTSYIQLSTRVTTIEIIVSQNNIFVIKSISPPWTFLGPVLNLCIQQMYVQMNPSRCRIKELLCWSRHLARVSEYTSKVSQRFRRDVVCWMLVCDAEQVLHHR